MFSFLLALLAISVLGHANTPLPQGPPPVSHSDCPSGAAGGFLSSPGSFKHANTTILSATWIPGGSNVTITGGQTVCGSFFVTSVDIYRIIANITTSSRSSTLSEIWLPNSTIWTSRILSTGGGGFSGCVDYSDMAYTTSKGFVATGDNGGHDGDTAEFFAGNDDVLIDFSYRARHVTIELAKEVVKAFYGEPHTFSYYLGCSTGGRQGFKAAQMFPEDFNGIVAGAPAVNCNNLLSWEGHFSDLTGANATDPRFLTPDHWAAVHTEVLRQCDEPLDGVADGILEDSSICQFDPSPLLCSATTNVTFCLTSTQAQTVRNVYSPLFGLNGTFLYPRFSPGTELNSLEPVVGYLGGSDIEYPIHFYQYAVYNLSFDARHIGPQDYAFANALDAQHGYYSTNKSDLSAFRDIGGKVITYHGMADPVIASEGSMYYYDNVAKTMGLSNEGMDTFYRFFRISGMLHCSQGLGAWAFGQSGDVADLPGNNVIDDIVNWVEHGIAPDRLVGTKPVNDSDITQGISFQRAHCRYPLRTTYVGGDPNLITSWTCELIHGWQNVSWGISN